MEKKPVSEDLQIEEIPKFLPMLPVMDTVLFPKILLPLEVVGKESVQLLEDAINSNGIIDKVLAVKRSNLKTIILPKENEKDLLEIPYKLRIGIKFYFCTRMSVALKIVLTKCQKKRTQD